MNLNKLNVSLYLSSIILLSSCGKQKQSIHDENESNILKVQSQETKYSIRNIVSSSDGSGVVLSQGFNKMSYSFANSCVSAKNIENPDSIENSVVDFQSNLTESKLREMLNLGVKGSVPVKGINVSPEITYSRKAAATKLSSTSTYSVNVSLGTRKLLPDHEDKFNLLTPFLKYFDSDGNLIDPYNFINKCGDEIVISQKLSAKVYITAKLTFDSQSIMNEYSAKVGLSAKDFLTKNNDIRITTKVKFLDSEKRKHTTLHLYGIQFGGYPQELLKIVGQKNTCTLDNIEQCQAIIEKLNLYISRDFKAQLNVNNPASWYIEKSKTVPYDELSIASVNGKTLNFSLTNDYANSIELGKLKMNISRSIATQVNNYVVANSIFVSKDLAADETHSLIDILNKSEQNVDSLHTFSKECYRNISDCIMSSYNKLNSLMLDYDDSILQQTDVGELITKIQAQNMPIAGQTHRSSEDFLPLTSVLETGKFTSFYFKIKTIENNLIKDRNYTFSIMCNKPWYRGYDPVLFSGIYPGFEIMSDTVGVNYAAKCSGSENLYIADPIKIPMDSFIIEIWGRE